MTTQGISLTGVPVSGPSSGTADPPRKRTAALSLRSHVLSRYPAVTAAATDIAFVVIAILDVWLVVPEEAPSYSVYLSAAACAALLLRRTLPFTAVVLTVPGFFAGWAQLAGGMCRAGHQAPVHQAPLSLDQRQGRAVQPHPVVRVRLRPTLAVQPRTTHRPRHLGRSLQHSTRPLRSRWPTPSHPTRRLTVNNLPGHYS